MGQQQQALVFLKSLYEWKLKLPLIEQINRKNQQKLFIESWHLIFLLHYSTNFGHNLGIISYSQLFLFV